MGNCPSDREKVDGLCYKKCPDGWEHVPGMPYNCRLIGSPGPYGRGVGTIPGCDPQHVQSGALCYDPPQKGWHLLAATYWQDCPGGATDIGVACQRDGYNRGVGGIPWLELLSEALPWLTTAKDAAYAGGQVATGNYSGAASSVAQTGSDIYNVEQSGGD